MTRTWKYTRATDQQSAHYISSDGWEVWKIERTGYFDNETIWQRYAPGETGEDPDCREQYCTAKAAMKSVEEIL